MDNVRIIDDLYPPRINLKYHFGEVIIFHFPIPGWMSNIKIMDILLLGSYIRFSCSLIKWTTQRAIITIPPFTPSPLTGLTNWPINDRGEKQPEFNTSYFLVIISTYILHLLLKLMPLYIFMQWRNVGFIHVNFGLAVIVISEAIL